MFRASSCSKLTFSSSESEPVFFTFSAHDLVAVKPFFFFLLIETPVLEILKVVHTINWDPSILCGLSRFLGQFDYDSFTLFSVHIFDKLSNLLLTDLFHGRSRWSLVRPQF